MARYGLSVYQYKGKIVSQVKWPQSKSWTIRDEDEESGEVRTYNMERVYNANIVYIVL